MRSLPPTLPSKKMSLIVAQNVYKFVVLFFYFFPLVFLCLHEFCLNLLSTIRSYLKVCALKC